jgi:hypothetical protein
MRQFIVALRKEDNRGILFSLCPDAKKGLHLFRILPSGASFSIDRFVR